MPGLLPVKVAKPAPLSREPSAPSSEPWWTGVIAVADRPGAVPEAVRLGAVAVAGLSAIFPFLHNGIMGGDDARWYSAVVGDTVQQWRAGAGPAFVGQTYFGAVGTVLPLRVAPYLQHLTVLLDFLTGRCLTPYLLLNLALVVSAIAAGLSAYACVRLIAPQRRVEAVLLATLYAWCPGVIGLAYTGQLYMSAMAMPYLPIVFAGIVRIYRAGDFLGWALVAAGSAAAWLGHSPIGLWVCVAAAGALVVRIVQERELPRRELRFIAGAAVLFVGLCGYVFVSTVVLDSRAGGGGVPVEGLLATVRAMFPGALLPVSAEAGELSDLQLGYGLWFVLIVGGIAAWKGKGRLARGLVLVAAGLICLTLPVPLITPVLWHGMPQTVVTITNSAPMQRLYSILAACTVVLAAVALASGSPILGRRERVLAALALAVAWSGFELHAFVHRGSLIETTTERSEELLAPQNLVLSRYSMGLLSENDRFFSNGYMDFELEQRLLQPDLLRPLLSNVSALAPGAGPGARPTTASWPEALSGSPDGTDPRWVNLAPKLTLQPGQHYLLALDFLADSYTGVLQVTGPGIIREYQLPRSGDIYAFGSSLRSSHFIPLWSNARQPVEVTVTYLNQDPGVDSASYRDFARYALIPYQPEALPIHLVSLFPYVTEVKSPSKGWLETFRFYTPGWMAMVNGRPVPIARSFNDLVAVPVEAGASEVTLTYEPPAVLAAAYWATWVAWLGTLAYFGISAWRALRHREAPVA